MTRQCYDVAVVGLGGMGSSIAYHLSGLRLRVVGIDRYAVPHPYGSSHGGSRLIRLAYFEDSSYVPLLKRAYQLWDELQVEARQQLIFQTGSIDAAPPGHKLFDGALRSCLEHGLEHEVMDSESLRRRFPGFSLRDDHRILFQPRGGYVSCEDTIKASVRLAERGGVDLLQGEQVLRIVPASSGFSLTTTRRTLSVGLVILANGGWLRELAPELQPYLAVERQVMGWFPPSDAIRSGGMPHPVFNIVTEAGRFGGIPHQPADHWKMNLHNHLNEIVEPDHIDRHCTDRDVQAMEEFSRRYLSRGVGSLVRASTCLYTNTPDENFIIDWHPSNRDMILVSACSGHGFKFVPVIGEIVAQMAQRQAPAFNIDLFGMSRFLDCHRQAEAATSHIPQGLLPPARRTQELR
jgi:sarcosine oxidase